MVKVLVQRLFVIASDGQTDTRLGFGAVIVYNPLAHMQGIDVQSVADISFYGLESGCLGDFGNLDASTLGGKVQNHALSVA